MILGKNNDKGLILDGWKLKVVTIGENGMQDDILVMMRIKRTVYADALSVSRLSGSFWCNPRSRMMLKNKLPMFSKTPK